MAASVGTNYFGNSVSEMMEQYFERYNKEDPMKVGNVQTHQNHFDQVSFEGKHFKIQTGLEQVHAEQREDTLRYTRHVRLQSTSGNKVFHAVVGVTIRFGIKKVPRPELSVGSVETPWITITVDNDMRIKCPTGRDCSQDQTLIAALNNFKAECKPSCE